jgi:hypothetical protein
LCISASIFIVSPSLNFPPKSCRPSYNEIIFIYYRTTL